MSDLINRLLGKYPMGPIQDNGEPEFGYRQFDGLPAINKEAAEALAEEQNKYDAQAQYLSRVTKMLAASRTLLMEHKILPEDNEL